MKKSIYTKKYTYKQRGMTLIELMASIMIFGAITSAAIPVMKSMFERNSILSVGELFVQSMKLARAEAIARSRTMTVTPLSGSLDWSGGWEIVYTNDSGEEETIREFPAIPRTIIFTSDTYNNSTLLQIGPSGSVSDFSGTFTMRYPDCTGREEQLNYSILLSGLFRKGVSTCP